nr:hypothetical protein [Tanacetum cinerariifolium]
RREGGEHASASTPSEPATGSAGKSTTRTQSKQLSASESAFAEEPEVYKATTDQLDGVNPEGQQYPHNLLQPLPLISDNQGRRVISFEHFINNYLEYLWGEGDHRCHQSQDYGMAQL